MTHRAQQIFKPEFRFGLGGVSLGNEFNKQLNAAVHKIYDRVNTNPIALSNGEALRNRT